MDINYKRLLTSWRWLGEGLIYLCTIAITMLASCTKEAADNTVADEEQLTLIATNTATRTTLADDHKTVAWTTGDRIAVYDGKAAKHAFEATVREDGYTSFTGKVTAKTHDIVAVYPFECAGDTWNTSTNTVTATVPTAQTAVRDGFADGTNISVSAAKRSLDGTPTSVTFHNVCQLLKFSIPQYADNKITSVRFSANTPIAGGININLSAATPVVTTSEGNAKDITLTAPESTPLAAGTYYIICAPVRIEGFSMSLVADGQTYTLSSTSTFGGTSAKVYDLGPIDLIGHTTVTSECVYDEGVLQGTQVSMTAPVTDGSAWNAVIKNANGDVVRTLTQASGTLTSPANDALWPYLPKGTYTVDYTYSTSRGTTINESTSFAITEDPVFNIDVTAKSSYSYYLDGDIDRANACNAMTIYEPTATVKNIAKAITDKADKYAALFSAKAEGFGSTLASSVPCKSFTFTADNATALGATSRELSVTFDGKTVRGTASVHITGLPYTCRPPKQAEWSGNANSWRTDYVRLHNNTITKSFNLPADVNVNVTQDVTVRSATVGTTYELKVSGTTLKSINPAYNKNIDDKGTYNGTMSSANPTVQCINSYGNDDTLISTGTNTKVKGITVNYR